LFTNQTDYYSASLLQSDDSDDSYEEEKLQADNSDDEVSNRVTIRPK